MKGARYNYFIVLLILFVLASSYTFPCVTGHESAVAGSDKEARLIVLWNDEWMEDDPAVPALDEDVIFNYDPIRGSMYYLGDELANVQIQVWLDDTDDLDNVVCTLQASGVVTVHDGTDSPGGIWVGGTTKVFNFTIDVGTCDQVEMTYPLTLTIDYDDITTGMNNQQDTFNLEIYISSIFDNATDDSERDEHDELPNLYEVIGTPEFEEGETYQEGVMELIKYAPGNVTNLTATFDSPGSTYGFPFEIGFTDDIKSAFIPTFTSPQDIKWWIDVALGFAPGEYNSNLDFKYTRNGKVCVEEDHVSCLYVGPSTRVTGPAGGPTNNAEVNISYTMTGAPLDVDLYYTRNNSVPYEWVFIGTDPTPDGYFKFSLTEEGSYGWFAVSENETVPNSTTAPETSYLIFEITPPDMMGFSPEHASVNVSTDQVIWLSFSEPMNMTSVIMTIEPDVYIWSSYWDDWYMNFSHQPMTFNSGTRYWINITAGKDLAGNNLSSLPYSFYFDTERSTARARGPIDHLTDEGWVTILYTRTSNPDHVDLYYTTNLSEPFSWTFINTDNSVDGRYNWLLPTDGSYGWYAVSPNEAAPTQSDPPQASYYVYDGTPPQVLYSVPSVNADDFYVNDDVRITFSEAMVHWSVESSFMVTPFRDTRFTWDDTTLIITFLDDFEEGREDLEPGREYTIRIETNARDLAGNNLSEPFVLTFTPKEEPIDTSIILWAILIEAIVICIIVLLWLMRKKRRREATKAPTTSEINIKENAIPEGSEDNMVSTTNREFG